MGNTTTRAELVEKISRALKFMEGFEAKHLAETALATIRDAGCVVVGNPTFETMEVGREAAKAVIPIRRSPRRIPTAIECGAAFAAMAKASDLAKEDASQATRASQDRF